MKSIIFTIGTVLLSFGSANAETKGNVYSIACEKAGGSTEIKSLSIITGEVKTQEETIAEDNQITEAQIEYAAPLLPGKSAEEVISDEVKIVEGVDTKIYPLDFGKINQKEKPLKMNNKRLIGSL